MPNRFAVAVALFASLVAGCVTDYALVAPEKIVYVEVEVPVEAGQDTGIETEPDEPAEIWVDHFYQSSIMNGIDILWVIDNSGSMNSHTPRLLNGIDQMMISLGSLGPTTMWRLAMISADPSKAILENQFPLTYGSTLTDAIDMFDMMNKGQFEEGFDAVHDYINDNSYASTWLRDDAGLLIVFVSDEEEQGSLFTSGADFSSWLSSLGRPQVYVASIVNHDPSISTCNYAPTHTGDRYMDAANFLSGVVIDICSEDWTAGVDDATRRLEPVTEYRLSWTPVADSVSVFVDGYLYDPSLWYYEPSINSVVFTETDPTTGTLVGPPANSLVEIGYEIQ